MNNEIRELIEACKQRAKENYNRYHMFVECYGEEEWGQFVSHYERGALTVAECFKMMDTVADYWAEQSATGEW